MSTKVIAVFNNRSQADRAVAVLREQGYDRDISVLGKEDVADQMGRDQGRDRGEGRMNAGRTDTVMDGSATGGAIGGLAGLAAGAGALVIPGIGPLLAAGPLAGAITGAVSGGLAGGLIDWGIPREESRRYEDEIKRGGYLVSVECSEEKSENALDILRQSGAGDVKKH